MQRVATLEVLVVGGDVLLQELSAELCSSGHRARVVEASEVPKVLREIAPDAIVLGDSLTQQEAAAVRVALRYERRARNSRIVAIGEEADGTPGTLTLPACLSARELVKQLVAAIGTRAATDAPPAVQPEESGRFLSGRVLSGVHAVVAPPPRSSDRPVRSKNEQAGVATKGFQGDVAAIEMPSLVQLVTAQRRTGVLLLVDDGRALGSIHFEEGQIVHAETSAGSGGADAFYRLMAIHTGHFAFRVREAARIRTIHDTPTALLLEALRRRDETRSA